MAPLSQSAHCALFGEYISLENITKWSQLLPDHDKHLLVPPANIVNPQSLDLINILKKRKSDGGQLFLEMIQTYFNADRILRVCNTNIMSSHIITNITKLTDIT